MDSSRSLGLCRHRSPRSVPLAILQGNCPQMCCGTRKNHLLRLFSGLGRPLEFNPFWWLKVFQKQIEWDKPQRSSIWEGYSNRCRRGDYILKKLHLRKLQKNKSAKEKSVLLASVVYPHDKFCELSSQNNKGGSTAWRSNMNDGLRKRHLLAKWYDSFLGI